MIVCPEGSGIKALARSPRTKLAGLALIATLATGCNPDANSGGGSGSGAGSGGGSAPPVVFSYSYDDSVFQQSFQNLTSFSGFEITASNIRAAANFAEQQFKSVTTNSNHFSFDTSDIEYAHAVGLTGQGQIIAVADDAFQVFGTTAHDELANKSMTLYGNVYTPPATDACETSSVACHGAHGTAVAAIAASDGSSGQIVGVAPGADLILVSWESDANLTAATNGAAAAGAIVQNNSWGYDGYPATQVEFSNLQRSSSAYLNALSNFAQTGVLVFSASNDETAISYDLSGALPDFMPELEESFLLVGNVTPYVDNNGKIVSAKLLSSACLEAARYCLVADGTVHAPDILPGQPYETDMIAEWSGTSFAAPQVSGAIALLAEAFPTLTGKELRARLLASADNSFFSHEGYVEFTDSVRHGFNSKYGHGFLNVGAALLPIGGRYVANAASGPIPIDRAKIVSRGSAGASVSRALQGVEYLFQDGLGTDFKADASTLSAHAKPTTDPNGYVQGLMAQFSTGPSHEMAFARYLSGTTIEFGTDAGQVSVLAPLSNSGPSHVGASWWTGLDAGNAFSGSFVVEDGSILGLSNGYSDQGDGALQVALGFEASRSLGHNTEASFAVRAGLAAPLSRAEGLAHFETSSFTEASAEIAWANVSQLGDRFSLKAELPQAILHGQGAVTLPTSRAANGDIQSRTVEFDLAPEARALDLSISYSRPLGSRSDVVFSGKWTMNAGHIAGETDAIVGLGLQYRF